MLASLAFTLLTQVPPQAIKAQDSPRPVWDQKRAIEVVKKVKQFERDHPDWDKINWLKDSAKAAEEAKRQNKPIFVFWYVKKGGPASAPC
jgi:hypothetical protein